MTPREIENLLDEVAAGHLDDNLKEIQVAIVKRQEAQRKKLLDQVHQVFGPNADIVIKR